MKKDIKTQNYSSLVTDLASLIEQGRKTAVRYVNTALVATYWLVGRKIVEYEQKEKERAEYGETFYLLFPIRQTVSAESSKLENKQTLSAELSTILQTPSEESTLPLKSHTVSGKFQKGYTLSIELEPIFQTVSGISETLSRKLKDRDFWK